MCEIVEAPYLHCVLHSGWVAFPRIAGSPKACPEDLSCVANVALKATLSGHGIPRSSLPFCGWLVRDACSAGFAFFVCFGSSVHRLHVFLTLLFMVPGCLHFKVV